LLCELQKSLHKTILLVTHDPRAAERAERVLHLEKGQLVDTDTAPAAAAYRSKPSRNDGEKSHSDALSGTDRVTKK
jgi:ABC-type lipoprotein export system ATPase subunit